MTSVGCRPRPGVSDPFVAEPPRRFPAPWHADPMPGGYVVRDANGQALAYLYSRENAAEARQAKVLTADEARRVALNIRSSRDMGQSGWGRDGFRAVASHLPQTLERGVSLRTAR
jgi:hypothetical protein